MPDWLILAFDLVKQERYIDAIASILKSDEETIDVQKFLLLQQKVRKELGHNACAAFIRAAEEGADDAGSAA